MVRRQIVPYSQSFPVFEAVAQGEAVFVDWLASTVHVRLRYPGTGIHLMDTGAKMSPKYPIAWHARDRGHTTWVIY